MTKTRRTHTRQSINQFWVPYWNGLCWSTLSPWSLHSAFSLPPYKILCLHWDIKMVFEAWACQLLRLLTPEYITFLFNSTCLISLTFVMTGNWTWVSITVLKWKILKNGRKNEVSTKGNDKVNQPQYVHLRSIMKWFFKWWKYAIWAYHIIKGSRFCFLFLSIYEVIYTNKR